MPYASTNRSLRVRLWRTEAIQDARFHHPDGEDASGSVAVGWLLGDVNERARQAHGSAHTLILVPSARCSGSFYRRRPENDKGVLVKWAEPPEKNSALKALSQSAQECLDRNSPPLSKRLWGSHLWNI